MTEEEVLRYQRDQLDYDVYAMESEIADLKRQLGIIQKENELLRKLAAATELRRKLTSLREQNAKLREALSHALFLCGEGVVNYPQAALCSLRVHLRSALRETSDEGEADDAE